MTGSVLLAVLAAATPAGAVRMEEPAAMLDAVATPGRSIDLSDIAEVRARLRAPELRRAATKPTVALYEGTPYHERPGTVFSFHEAAPGCTKDFSITQRARGT